MENLFARIETLCEKKGIRPGRLCDEVGISRGLMTDLKMGRKKSVTAETARKIAGYLEVSVETLLGGGQSRDMLEEVDVAFYGDFRELDEVQKEAVRDMVRVMRQRRAAKQQEKG